MTRWATMAVLFGLLAAGITYDRLDIAPEPDALPLEPRVATPAIMADVPLSNVWFCPVGSGAVDGYAPHVLGITNVGTEPAIATIDLMTESGPGNAVVIEVAENSTEVFDVGANDAGGVVGAVVEVVGGRGIVGHRVTTEFGATEGPCSTATADTWYFAGGSTTRDAHNYVALLNPFAQDVVFRMEFQTTTRTREPDDLKSAVVPGRSVRLIDVGEYVSREAHVATRIETVQGQLAVERLQVFDGELGPRGAALQLGVPDASREWVLPAGRVHEAGDHQLVVFNPGDVVAQFDVEFDLDPADRASYGLVPIEASVQPGRLVVLDLVEVFTSFGLPLPYDVGVRVRSANEVPVVVERHQLSPPIDTSLIGAGGDQARLVTPGIRSRQTDTDPDEIPEEEFGARADPTEIQPSPDTGAATSRGSRIAADQWYFPYLTLGAAADGVTAVTAVDGPATTILAITGDPGTAVSVQIVLAGELLGPVRATVGDSGMVRLGLPVPVEAAALAVGADAPIWVEAQTVVPGELLGVVTGVPVLDEAGMAEAIEPDATAESELPVTTTVTNTTTSADATTSTDTTSTSTTSTNTESDEITPDEEGG